jgi:O-antigen ligase
MNGSRSRNAGAAGRHHRGLAAVQTGALIGVVFSVILLGHTTETSPYFHVLISVSLIAYVLARGEDLLETLLEYLTSRIMLWRWAFAVWAILSLLWTFRGRVSVDRAITIVEIQFVGLIFYDAAKKLRLGPLMLWSVFACSVVAVAHALLTSDAATVSRLSGLYSSPNALGIVAVMGLACFCSGIGNRLGSISRVLSYIGALVLLAGVLTSVSKKSIVSALFVLVVSPFYRETRARAGILVATAVTAGVALVAAIEPLRQSWQYFLFRMQTSLATFGSSFVVSQSTSERTRFVQKGLSLIAEAPIAGRGLDTFRWLSDERTYSHNNVVEVGVALGIIGVVLYYGFYVALIRAALAPGRRRTLGGRYAFLVVSTLALLDIGLVSYTFKVPALLMIMCAGWLEGSLAADGVRREGAS